MYICCQLLNTGLLHHQSRLRLLFLQEDRFFTAALVAVGVAVAVEVEVEVAVEAAMAVEAAVAKEGYS